MLFLSLQNLFIICSLQNILDVFSLFNIFIKKFKFYNIEVSFIMI